MAQDWGKDDPHDGGAAAGFGGNDAIDLPEGVKPSTAGAGRGKLADTGERTDPNTFPLSPISSMPEASSSAPVITEPRVDTGSVLDDPQLRRQLESAPLPRRTRADDARDTARSTRRGAALIPATAADPAPTTIGPGGARDPVQAQDALAEGAGLLAGDRSMPERIIAKTAAQGAEALGGVTRAVGDFTGIKPLATFGANAAHNAQLYQQGIGQPRGGSAFKSPYLADQIENAGASLLNSYTLARAFGPRAVIPLMSTQDAGSYYNEARQAGKDPLAALALAVPHGTFEAIGEKFTGTDRAMDALRVLFTQGAGKEALKDAGAVLLKAGVKEVPGELITYLGQSGIDVLPGVGIRPNMTMGEFIDGLRDTTVQAAIMGGFHGAGHVAADARAQLAEPRQRSAEDIARDKGFLVREQQAKKLAAAGEKEVAATMQRGIDAERAQGELEALADKPWAQDPQFVQAYRQARVSGIKPAEAAARTAMTTAFQQLATQGGMNEKAAARAIEFAAKLPLEKVPAFLEGFTSSLQKQGLAQPTPPETVAGAVSAVRDDALRTQLEAVYDDTPAATTAAITDLEAKADAAGSASEPAQSESQPPIPATDGAQSASKPSESGSGGPAAAPVAPAEFGTADGPSNDHHTGQDSPKNDLPESTTAQKLAGNAKMAHIALGEGSEGGKVGVTIETPATAIREDKHNRPPQWRTRMDHGYSYGYFKRTEGADSTEAKRQGVDAFVKEGLPETWAGDVFVVDQVNPKNGKFDEHKVMVGPENEEQARADYLKHYEKGWKGLGAVTRMTWAEFQDWRKAGKRNQPVGELAPRAPTPLRLGITPADAVPVTVREGIVHIGEDVAYDYNTGEPVQVTAGATDTQIREALKKAEAVSRRMKFFGGNREAVAPATAAQENAPAQDSTAAAAPQGPGSQQASAATPDAALAAPSTEEGEQAAPPEGGTSATASAPAVSANTVFTDDAAAAARALLRKKLGGGTLNSGVDPEILQAGLTLAGWHIEKGARTFATFAKSMLEDMGEMVRPYLKSWYMAAKFDPRAGEFSKDMSSAAFVEEFDLAAIAKPEAGPNEAPAVETPAKSADTGQEAHDDSTPPAKPPADDRKLAAIEPRPGSSEPAVIRGAVAPSEDAGRADDGGLRQPDQRAAGADDAAQGLGERGGDQGVPHGRAGNLERSRERLLAGDHRAPVGSLTREGSWQATARRNIDLIELALKIQSESRAATPEEQALLSKYVGFGAGEIRNKLFPVPSQYARQQEPDRLIWPNLVYEASWKALAERLDKLPREWQQSVLKSTQYAHYTSENIVRSTWAAVQRRLGFTGGKILEPGVGIGNFAMAMPESMRRPKGYTGIEMDGPTALIARLLSPAQNMLHEDFIKRKLPRDFFDLAIGNPPFSQTKILGDPDYEKHGFMLHDFFFAKTIDRVRPGGLLVFVTSKGTMDKQSDRARKYLGERADLLGAIRLPSTAFEANADTSVVTDVIFLRKREAGAEPTGEKWLGVATVETKDGPIVINEYFAAHPDMVLGQNRISGNEDDEGRRINSNGYGGERYTVVSYDKTPEELDAKFAAAVQNLPQNAYSTLKANSARVKEETRRVDYDPKVKREGVVYVDGKTLMRVESGVGRELQLSAKDGEWFRGYVALRDLVQVARQVQADDGDWELSLRLVNKAYDAFVKKHGPINDFRTLTRKTTDEDGNEVENTIRVFKNKRLLREDYDHALMISLEQIDEAGKIRKSPFLLGRTIGKPVTREVKTVGDALAVSLDELGRLDLEDVAQRLHIPVDETIEALGASIYKAPSGEWQLADEYLSGDVVAKLEEAQTAAAVDPSLERNIEALKAVQPDRLGPSQISVKLGAPWVPAEYVTEFAKEIGAGAVTYDSKTETWQVQGGNQRSERRAGAEYGTAARSPAELLEVALNSRQVTVKATVIDDGKRKEVTDAEATTAANEMLRKIKEKFKSWVWTDTERAATLVDLYNRRYNNIAPRRFDGAHLTLPGVSLRFKLHPHQLRAIWRQIQTGNTYLAHAVGAGKTIEMIAGGMEQRRLGLIKKPVYVVPNHMLEQFANEFMELYPLANIMVADDENFSAERRKAFIAAATMNGPDALIITHSAFERVGVKEESVAPIRDEILSDLQDELDDVEKGDRVRRSQLEQQIEAVEQRFDSIVGMGKKDNVVPFEDMGVDFIYADEAHAFRKLDFSTNQKIKGIDPQGSRRALDMYVKTRVLERRRPGRAFAFASGTPVTNTMGELYTLMRFFVPEEMGRAGITSFDSWARQFGEVGVALEANAAGRYENVTRFSKFDNVPELMSRVRQFMDVLTSEHLGALVKRPDLEGGKPNLVMVEGSKALKSYMRTVLSPRLEASRKWKPSFEQPFNPDPVLAIISDGRFAALDPRFFGGKPEQGEATKLDEMADRVVKTYHASADNVYVDKDTGKDEPVKGSTQLVFYNLGFGAGSMASRGFDARAHLTKRLTAGGVKRDQILWFDDANTDAKKEAMFQAMRNGKARILIGSAKKMGTGVNVQKRLIRLHYFDPPWFPADVEQPHGRILRQGNQNEMVGIDWYATKGAYDSTMWQMVARKQRFIDQAFSGDKSLRSMEDMSEASQYEQAAALASGDPRALQLAGYRQDVERLERLQAAHANEQIAVRDGLRSARWNIDNAERRIGQLEAALKALGGGYFQFTSGTVGERSYDKLGEFGQALKDAFNRAAKKAADGAKMDEKAVHLAKFGPVKVVGYPSWIGKRKGEDVDFAGIELFAVVGEEKTHVLTGTELGADVDPVGLGRRFVNAVNGISRELDERQRVLTDNTADEKRLNKKLGVPFEHQQEMLEKYAALRQLEDELRAEGEAEAKAQAAATEAAKPVVINEDGSTGDEPAADGEAPQFARGERSGGVSMQELRDRVAQIRGASTEQVGSMVRELTAGWKSGPRVHVVATYRDLPARFNAPPQVRGVHSSGEAWIVAAAHRNGKDARATVGRTLAHEAIAHFGLRKMLGSDFDRLLTKPMRLAIASGNEAMRKLRDEVRSLYRDADGSYNLSAHQEADEMAARAVEQAVDDNGRFRPGYGWLKAVWARVAQFLRDMGISVEFTTAELHGMLVAAQRGLERGERLSGGATVVLADAAQAAEGGPQQARGTDGADTPEFHRWFGDSKVVDAEGKPLVVYHWTNVDFSDFKPGAQGAIWFSDDPQYTAPAQNGAAGGRTIPVYLSLQNPAKLSFEQIQLLSAEDVHRLKAQGHDGAMLLDDEQAPTAEVAVFSTEQIKSAINPASPNLMESRGDGEQPPALADVEVALAPALATAIRRWQDGRLGERDLAAAIAAELQTRRAQREERIDRDRVRGPDWIRERLFRARRQQELNPGMVDLALWMLEQAPHMATDLGISVRTGGNADLGPNGTYNVAERVVTLFTHAGNEDTAVHEILHHTERMMPREVQDGIRREWVRALERAVRQATAKLRAPKKAPPAGAPAGWGTLDTSNEDDNADEQIRAMEAMLIAARQGDADLTMALWRGGKGVSPELARLLPYQLSTPSEYWAVNGARIINARGDAAGGNWIDRAVRWLGELIERAKGLLGLRSDAPVLRGLRAVMEGNGQRVSPMLAHRRGGIHADETAADPQEEAVAPQEWAAPDDTVTDKILYELQDGRIDLKRVQQAIAGAGRQIEEQFDARLSETLYPGRVARRSELFIDREVKPLLKAMARIGATLDEVGDFLLARHAPDRNAQIARVNPDLPDGGAGSNSRGELMTTQAAHDYLAAIPPERLALLEELGSAVDRITAGTRSILVVEGLEKQETVEAWEAAQGRHYVPLFKEDTEHGGAPHPVGTGFNVRGPASKRATGSTRQVQDVLAHVFMQREAAITRAEKNRVGLALYGLALSHPNRDFWTTIRPSMSNRAIEDELEAMGVDPDVAASGMQRVPTITDIDKNTGQVVRRPNPLYKSLPGAITVRLNGEDRVLMLNVRDERAARLAADLKNLDGMTRLDLAGSIVGKSTRWLAAVNTQYNPAFGLVNVTRDTWGGLVNLGSTPLRGRGLKVLADVPKAITGIGYGLYKQHRGQRSALAWSKLWEQFQLDGGRTGYREMFRTSDERAHAIERELRAAGPANAWLVAKKGGRWLLHLLDGFNETLENAVRLAAYKEALDKGLSRPEAARIGRELTVDFNRKGRSGRELQPLYAFFNASVQGGARTVETLKGPTGPAIIAGGLALGVIQALMLAMADYDEDEIPDFVKARSLIIPLPKDAKGEKRFLTIPYPLGLHVLPNTGRVLTELGLDGGKNMGKAIVGAIGELAGAFNPLGGGNIFTAHGALTTIAPTLVDPIVDIASNRNFAGSPIELESMRGELDNRPGYARARERTHRELTGQAYIEVSRALNAATGGTAYERGLVSPTPERLRYIAQTVGGGALREIEKAINSSHQALTGQEPKLSGVPVLGRFKGEVDPDRVTQSRYFEHSRELDKLQSSINAAKSAGDGEAIDKLVERPEAALIRSHDRVQRQLAKLNHLAATVVSDREELQAIDRARLDVMQGLNESFDAMEEASKPPTPGQRLKKAMRGDSADATP